MARHGKARKLQQRNQLGKITGFKKQGMHKKYAKMSDARIMTMFPDLAIYANNPAKLRAEAIKRLEERG